MKEDEEEEEEEEEEEVADAAGKLRDQSELGVHRGPLRARGPW